jgi:hypothetical protein
MRHSHYSVVSALVVCSSPVTSSTRVRSSSWSSGRQSCSRSLPPGHSGPPGSRRRLVGHSIPVSLGLGRSNKTKKNRPSSSASLSPACSVCIANAVQQLQELLDHSMAAPIGVPEKSSLFWPPSPCPPIVYVGFDHCVKCSSITRLRLRLAVDDDDPRTRWPPAHPWRTQVGPRAVDIRPLHCDATSHPRPQARVLERSNSDVCQYGLFQQQLYRAFVGVRLA